MKARATRAAGRAKTRARRTKAKAPRVHTASQPSRPPHRLLRGYAFDPSLATQLANALVSEVTYKVPWEPLEPGPVGEYLEVVDYDPASECFYAPVDLDHPYVLAQSGLDPSEGNPQFHQQMVYAAAMNTIDRFERALGRKTFWADRYESDGSVKGDAQFVQRLRVYPHALRMANAYYSRKKGALLFGYFPSIQDRTADQFPGGMVFTGLSHDIVAHETSHALLDGFHEPLLEATNDDALAFHEAFADIVALLQHFTFPDVLRHQIARARGELASENLLVQLATQFGRARGQHGALRDAMGGVDPATKRWVRRVPEAAVLDDTREVHARGLILVAAVFDAFVSIYDARTRDLLRLASGGTGKLVPGDLHPDLVGRLAQEAAKAATHVLNMCIRALDYCPPVDLTFGEYLRALITADMDLMPEDQHSYRVAFIEAFRRWRIFPDDVRTLAEDSLRWASPDEDPRRPPGEREKLLRGFIESIKLRKHVDQLRHKRERRDIWRTTRRLRAGLYKHIRREVDRNSVLERLTGLTLSERITLPDGVRLDRQGGASFSVSALREARRQREDGRALNQAFVTILQKETVEFEGQSRVIGCGSTLVLDLDESRVTYVIGKSLRGDLDRTVKFWKKHDGERSLRSTYFGQVQEPLAALHLAGAREGA